MFRLEKAFGDRSFRLIGDLDLASADSLIEGLRPTASRAGDIQLDLAELEFMDSSGIHALITVCMDLDEGQRLVLRSPGGEVSRVLRLVGADTFPHLAIEGDRARP
jgi:anti-sigma B factor antagonist